MNDYIKEHQHLSTIPFRYSFVDAGPDLNVPNILVPKAYFQIKKYSNYVMDPGYRPAEMDRILKTVFCVDYASRSPGVRWLARICEDTLINFAKLGDFISDMNIRHNPLKELVFKGHGLYGILRFPYPQGGAGFLLSQFGCQIGSKLALSFVAESPLLDDRALGRFLLNNGFPAVALGGGHFIGHGPGLGTTAIRKLSRGKSGISSLESCSIRKKYGVCDRFICPANNVIFFHVLRLKSMQELFYCGGLFFEADPRVFWLNLPRGNSRLCRWDDEILNRSLLFTTKLTKWGKFSYF
jgi:hypothetical protein